MSSTSTSPSSDPAAYCIKLIDAALENMDGAERRAQVSSQSLEEGIRDDVLEVMSLKRLSYPAVMALQLAFGVIQEAQKDLTKRPPGARGATGFAGRFSTYLHSRHIRTVEDAYQNIGKNSETLVRGNEPAFDRILEWASVASRAELIKVLDVIALKYAKQSRPVRSMPTLSQSRLTFPSVIGLVEGLLETPSEGAYEQFAVASAVFAIIDQNSQPGIRVETKALNASDASSKAAGDVQIMAGSRVLEAFEITANDWRTKIAGAPKKARSHDLARIHIVARLPDADLSLSVLSLADLDTDVSVLDLRHFVRGIVAALDKSHRVVMLTRMYEYLDRYQSRVELVNHFVEALQTRSLTE
jgi:hypothetical protein